MKRSLHQFRARPRKVIPPFPCCQCVEYAASDIIEKDYGHRFTSVIFAMDPEQCTALIETKEEFDIFGRSIVERMIHDRAWLQRVISEAESRMNEARDFGRAYLTKEALRDVSNQEASRRFTSFHELYRDLHFLNCPAWFFGGDALTSEVQSRLTHECPQEKDVPFLMNALLVSPELLSEQAVEEESLLRLAVQVQKSGAQKFDELTPSLKKQLDEHVAEFSSIPFGYSTGVVWGKEVFWARIEAWLQNAEFTRNPEAYLQAFLDHRKEVKVKRDAQERALNLSEETIYLLHCLRQIGYLQDVKKTTQVRSHPILVLDAYAEIAKRLDIDPEWMFSIDYREVAAFLAQGQIAEEQKKMVKARLDPYSVIIMRELQTEWITGEAAKAWMQENDLIIDQEHVKELRGSVANKGTARGRVCLARFSTEIGKMQEGDILVTAMTTPDFVPAMRKAAAIVTDEGGVTCHAAIVSRELHKPCVIGTKIATRVLKDGDIVEVDAEKGIVRIL